MRVKLKFAQPLSAANTSFLDAFKLDVQAALNVSAGQQVSLVDFAAPPGLGGVGWITFDVQAGVDTEQAVDELCWGVRLLDEHVGGSSVHVGASPSALPAGRTSVWWRGAAAGGDWVDALGWDGGVAEASSISIAAPSTLTVRSPAHRCELACCASRPRAWDMCILCAVQALLAAARGVGVGAVGARVCMARAAVSGGTGARRRGI